MGGEGGVGGGLLKIIFSALRASVWSKKMGGGRGGRRAGPMGPSPGSAAEVVKGYKKKHNK